MHTASITRHIAHRLSQARLYRRLTLDACAQLSGLSSARVGDIEVTGDLSVDELQQLANALRLPISHFLEECMLCGAALT